MQGRNDIDPTLQKYGFRPDSNTSDFVSDINVSGRRPAGRRTSCGSSASFRDWRVHTRTCRCSSRRPVLDQTNITSGLGNVTYQVNQNNRLTGFYSRQRYSKPNRLLNTRRSP